MEEIFGKRGLLARNHPEYEYRQGQLAMAEAVSLALEKKHHLMVEAGTGTGKTLAYLIPAIATGRRVVVSTGTKNLQEQLFFKDIPFLQKILPRPFRASYLKGRSNYLCLARLGKAADSPLLEGFDDIDHFGAISSWAVRTETGDRAELTELPANLPFWRHIDARSDICTGSKCEKFEACFITRARQRALDSEIVIVNHHLFFADLALRGREWGQVLPDYDAVIFDEAHQIEDIAMQYFGATVSTWQVADLIADINRLGVADRDSSTELLRAATRVMGMADQFWLNFQGADGKLVLQRSMFFRGRPGENQVATPSGERYLALRNALDRLIAALRVISDPPPDLEALTRRGEQLKFDLDFILSGETGEDTFVRWCERRGRGILLQAIPIDASGILGERLFQETQTVVMTSATLTANGSFDFIRSRLGLESAVEMIAESNYDYENQVLLYLPPQMPDPRDTGFTSAAAAQIIEILRASRGRAFVLSTSNAQMVSLRHLVEPEIDFPVFMQGDGSNAGILSSFRQTPHAVLFATAGFWQGVDVRGEALSCVIIDKLPFAVPSDPVVSARQRFIDQQGRSSFGEYSVPSAVIALKQGVGRLIRSSTDRGVLSILDPRLVTKSYGQHFIRSLPPCRMTRNIDEVHQFFASGGERLG
ncbi:MAG: DEAD/DEAH box helicase [Acidobacteria bacterium]|nr:DEAD/DEAH box helicase [Acidobacteriota bacterium]